MNLQTLLFAFVLSFVSGQDRKLQSWLNPGCDACTNSTTLVYVVATGSHDAIHQIWDFTTGVPTMIFSLTTLDTKLDIAWANVSIERFSFNQRPKYSFATVLDRVYEYHEDGRSDPKCKKNYWPLKNLIWSRSKVSLAETEVMIKMRGMYPGKNDTVDIKLDLIPYKDYAVDLPHLIHTGNSTLVEVSVVDAHSPCRYNMSRLGVRGALLSSDSATDTARCRVRKSLDDEHTPGVFEIIEIQTPESYSGGDGGFIQFRPVGYTEPERGVASSITARVSNFTRTDVREYPTLQQLFQLYDQVLAQTFIVSFGDDGESYQQHNFTSWSLTVGYGSPPMEGFSAFVLSVIGVGIGVPVLLALSGVVYVLKRRCIQRRSQPLIDDE